MNGFVEPRARAVRLAFDIGNLASFHQCFEAAQVLAHHELGIFAEGERYCFAQSASHRTALHGGSHDRAAISDSSAEVNRAAAIDVRTFERTPDDPLVLALIDDLRRPVDVHSHAAE